MCLLFTNVLYTWHSWRTLVYEYDPWRGQMHCGMSCQQHTVILWQSSSWNIFFIGLKRSAIQFIIFVAKNESIRKEFTLSLPLPSSHLQKSLGQSEAVNLWQPGTDFWGDLASLLIFLCGDLARSLKLFPCSDICPRWHGAVRTLLASVVLEIILEINCLGSLHCKTMPFSC